MNKILSLAILGGLAAVTTTQAQPVDTNLVMATSSTTIKDSNMVSMTSPNDEIKPMNTTTGAPKSDNKYGTLHSNIKNEVKHGN